MPNDWLLAGCHCCAALLALFHDTEFDACTEFPCIDEPPESIAQASCTDVLGGAQSEDGRQCTCPSGLFYEEYVGCTTNDPGKFRPHACMIR
jgi:hypothetical protein